MRTLIGLDFNSEAVVAIRNRFSNFVEGIKANNLRSIVLATSLVQLLVGFAFFFRLEPFRHLFKPAYDGPYPAPLGGIEELFYAYWYTFVFGLTGLIVYLGRRWPAKRRIVFHGILAAWLITFFSVFYLFAKPFMEGVPLVESYEKHYILSFNWPVVLLAIFGPIALVTDAAIGQPGETEPQRLDSSFKATLAFVGAAVVTPPIFVLVMLGTVTAVQIVVAIAIGH